MANNIFEPPKLTKPIQAYDPTKSVQQNMNGQGKPSAQDIISAYQTPQAQLQLQQGNQQQTTPVKDSPTDSNRSTWGMENIIQQMYTSPEQEEKMRKASVANQKILAIGDALRHIGNIANTVNYAPAQQFNSPFQEEQARYEKGKALRDKANQTYISYQQAKAAQDAKQRQWEATFNYNAAKDAAAAAALQQYRDRTIQERGRIADQNYRLGVRRADDAKAANEARIKEQNRHNRVSEGQRSQSLKMQRERTTAYVNRQTGGGNSGRFNVSTAIGTLSAPSKSTELNAHLKELYFQAEKNNEALAKQNGWIQGFDGSYRDASGKPVNDSRLVNVGNINSVLFGNKRDYDAALKAVMGNKQLAEFARDELRWGAGGSGGGGTPASDWEQYAEEEEDDWSQYEE